MDYELFNIRNPRDYNKYYSILKSWWEGKGNGWKAILPQFLSSRGIIVNDGEPICAAWLYTTDSSYGIINWIITNNHSKPKIKKRALIFMLEKLEIYAKSLQIEMIYTAMETNSLKKILNERNFLETSNISEFVKKI
jgi:hypothetical protein